MQNNAIRIKLMGSTGAGKTCLLAGIARTPGITCGDETTKKHVKAISDFFDAGGWPDTTRTESLARFTMAGRHFELHDYDGKVLMKPQGVRNCIIENETLPDAILLLLNPNLLDDEEKSSKIADLKQRVTDIKKNLKGGSIPGGIALVTTACDRFDNPHDPLAGRKAEFDALVAEIDSGIRGEGLSTYSQAFPVTVTGRLDDQTKPALNPAGIAPLFEAIFQRLDQKQQLSRRHDALGKFRKWAIVILIGAILASIAEGIREKIVIGDLQDAIDKCDSEIGSSQIVKKRERLNEIGKNYGDQFILFFSSSYREKLLKIDEERSDLLKRQLDHDINDLGSDGQDIAKQIRAWSPLTEEGEKLKDARDKDLKAANEKIFAFRRIDKLAKELREKNFSLQELYDKVRTGQELVAELQNNPNLGRQITEYQHALDGALRATINREVEGFKQLFNKGNSGLHQPEADAIRRSYRDLEQLAPERLKAYQDKMAEITATQDEYVTREVRKLVNGLAADKASDKLAACASWCLSHDEICQSKNEKYRDQLQNGINKLLNLVAKEFTDLAKNNDFAKLRILCGSIQHKGDDIGRQLTESNLARYADVYVAWHDNFHKISPKVTFVVQNEPGEEGKSTLRKIKITECSLSDHRNELKEWNEVGRIDWRAMPLADEKLKPETILRFYAKGVVDIGGRWDLGLFNENFSLPNECTYFPAVDGGEKKFKDTCCKENAWYLTYQCNATFAATVKGEEKNFPVKFSDMRNQFWGKNWEKDLLEKAK